MSAAAGSEVRRFGGAARWLLNITIALGLLGLVVWRANPRQLADQYSDFEPWPAVAATLLNVPLLLLITYRGRLILGRLGHAVPFLALLPISTLGNVVGSLTPAAAGDLLRTPFFKDRHDIPHWDGLAAIAYERGLSTFVLALSTAVAAAWMTLGVAAGIGVAVACAVLALAGPALAALVLARLRGNPVADEGGEARSLVGRLRSMLGRSIDSLLVLLRDPVVTVVIGTVNIAVFAIMAGQVWLIVEALGLELSPAEAWTALGAALLAGIISLVPLGLGTTDAAFAAVIGATQDGFDAGAAAAVLLRATISLPLGAAAFVSYLYLAGARRREGSS